MNSQEYSGIVFSERTLDSCAFLLTKCRRTTISIAWMTLLPVVIPVSVEINVFLVGSLAEISSLNALSAFRIGV